jgi:hypothetical protein
MRQIEVINQETIIDVSAEVTNVEILVYEPSEELAEKYALEAQLAAQQAEASATAASESADEAAQDAIVATNQALLASAARLNAQNAANAASDSEDAAALSAASALASATSAELDAIATAADRVQTGLDRQATGADRVQTGLDRVATGADRVQTGIDANTALTQAGVATTQAGIATTQAGIATTQAGNALTSANNALNSANAAAASAASAAQVGTSTLLTGFATGANTTILGTDSILGAFQKAQGQINARVSGTGANGQVAFWSGTGSQTGDNGLFWDNTNKRLGVGTNAPSQRLHIFDSAGLANNTFLMTSAVGRANIISFQNTTLTTQGAIISTGSSWAFGTYLQNQLNIAGGSGGVGIRVSSPQNINFYAGNADADFSQNVFRLFGGTGNVLIQNGGTFTDAGFRLDVNGTARVQGNLTVGTTAAPSEIGTVNISASSNSIAGISIRNTSSESGSTQASIWLQNSGTSRSALFKLGVNYTTYKTLSANDLGFYNFNGGNISILNDFLTGNINFTAGGASTPHAVIGSNGIFSIGTTSPNASAQLQIDSTTRGFLLPRMTSAQRDAIASPATGLMVYNTTDNRPSFFNGTSWINL